MNLSVSARYVNLNHNQTFCANNQNRSQNGKNRAHKAAAYILGGLISLNVLQNCGGCSNIGNSGCDTSNNLYVEYYDVNRAAKDSVMQPVYNLKAKLNEKNDFLKDTKFCIANSFDKLNGNDDFIAYLKNYKNYYDIKGVSFYSDSKLSKRVAVQDAAHNYQCTDINQKYSRMRQSVMHEVGHLFDNYFGHDHLSDYALRWDSLMYSKDIPYNFATVSKEDAELDYKYNYNNSLSDKKEFQSALLKDLSQIGRMYRRYEKMPSDLSYYIDGFDFYGRINEKDVYDNNSSRAEIYAQLFSYAIGENDGEKDLFIKCFKNSYEIVKNDIGKFLNIKCV